MTTPMPNDPIGRHLDARAQEIHLPRTDVTAIAERAAARTTRRRRATAGIATVAVLATGSFALANVTGDDDRRTPLATSPDAVVSSPLDWTVVDPTSSIGYDALRHSVVGEDGSLYSLSTQPGPAAPENANFTPRTVYRSNNGTEWEPLTLPEQLYASSLATAGSRLYAVGTGPTADDVVPLRVSTSDDGGTSWTDPVDLPTLPVEAAHPKEVYASPPQVAVHGDTTVVAYSVQMNMDFNARLPASLRGNSASLSPEGVTVFGNPTDCEAEAVVRADGLRDPAAAGGGADCPPPQVLATLTWDQLGVEPELAALISPQLHVFTSTAGSPFVEAPAVTDRGASQPQVVATDDGFTLATASYEQWDPRGPAHVGSTQVFTSVDGTTWTQSADVPELLFASLGVAGGQAMLAGSNPLNQEVVAILGAAGVATTVVPTDAIGEDGWTTNFYGAGSFGPLGWAAVAYGPSDGEEAPPTQIVHSDATGTVLSAVPVPEELDGWGAVGVMVTPDAIVVRYERSDGALGTPNEQRLLVGTPRG